MTDTRSVAVARARQGGYSVRPLPSPVQYQAADAEELIVYWTSTGPAATNGNITWTSTEINTGYATTTFQGQLATRAIPFIESAGGGMNHRGIIDESIFSIGTSDFTIECWTNPGASAVDEVALVTMRTNGGIASLLTGGNDGEWTEDGAMDNYSTGTQIRYEDNPATTTGWIHQCIQKQGTLGIYHSNGERQLFIFGVPTAGNQEIGNLNMTGLVGDLPGSGIEIRASPFATAGTSTAVGQIRITKSARYGTENFTPPSEAFYIP